MSVAEFMYRPTDAEFMTLVIRYGHVNFQHDYIVSHLSAIIMVCCLTLPPAKVGVSDSIVVLIRLATEASHKSQ